MRLTLTGHPFGPDETDVTWKRKKTVEIAEVAREQYAQEAETLLDEVFPEGPSVLKSAEGVRIVATRRINFDEPTFG